MVYFKYYSLFSFNHLFEYLSQPEEFLQKTFNAFKQGFPKVDHSGVDARVVLERINSAKKTTSNRT